MRKKETPNPSRVRGRGVEVSETLFYLENIRLWCTIKKTCPERRPIWQSMY